MKIVETCNFDKDYPDEKFVDLPPMRMGHAMRVADAINEGFPPDHPRFWRVVEDDYKLAPGFEP
jgi:hypothetical protein